MSLKIQRDFTIPKPLTTATTSADVAAGIDVAAAANSSTLLMPTLVLKLALPSHILTLSRFHLRRAEKKRQCLPNIGAMLPPPTSRQHRVAIFAIVAAAGTTTLPPAGKSQRHAAQTPALPHRPRCAAAAVASWRALASVAPPNTRGYAAVQLTARADNGTSRCQRASTSAAVGTRSRSTPAAPLMRQLHVDSKACT